MNPFSNDVVPSLFPNTATPHFSETVDRGKEPLRNASQSNSAVIGGEFSDRRVVKALNCQNQSPVK